jgi:cytochrome c oxidase assembly protein subunit 15
MPGKKTSKKTASARKATPPAAPSGDRGVMIWLLAFAVSVAILVVWGGYTRLTRSGLSIVEWHPISGVMPPIGEQAWQEEFAKYQQTPEFKIVNSDMTLDEYRFIFYIEWIHRLLARLIGLLYALPFFYFVFTKRIAWRTSGIYVGMGVLFVFQAFAGWFMVASGLEDRPAVSHYLLTFHLMLALSLFSLALWTAFGHLDRFKTGAGPGSPARRLTAISLGVLALQIIYGGLTAGLKAGHISDTWPLMMGRFVPPGFLTTLQPWIANLFEAPQSVMFVHRWLAFLVLALAAAAYLTARRTGVPRQAQAATGLLAGLILLQIVLGIAVVLLHVRIDLALLHQTMAIGLLAVNLLALHRLGGGAPAAVSRPTRRSKNTG